MSQSGRETSGFFHLASLTDHLYTIRAPTLRAGTQGSRWPAAANAANAAIYEEINSPLD